MTKLKGPESHHPEQMYKTAKYLFPQLRELTPNCELTQDFPENNFGYCRITYGDVQQNWCEKAPDLDGVPNRALKTL